MGAPLRGGIDVFPDPAALAAGAAAAFAGAAREDVAARGRMAVALSGGHTPRPFHRQLAAAPAGTIPWERVHLFWGDERRVPAGDPESNFGAARNDLLCRVPLPPANAHPAPVEEPTARAVAARYERELRCFFGKQAVAFPVFDLVLLGLGADGHVASLFPGGDWIAEDARWVVPVHAPAGAGPRERVSVTLPVINNARRVWFLAAGAAKAAILRAVRGGDERYPAALVRPRGELRWFVDRAAAKK